MTPSIVHVLDRFDVGGMETVVLELIRRTQQRYRHRVLALRDEGALAARLRAIDVPVESLGKRAGKDMRAYLRLRRRLRALSPDIVHTYNIGAIDVAVWARAAGVGTVIHAEHGRDASDPDGSNARYRWLRRLLAPLITRFVAVSADLADWLVHDIRIPAGRVLTLKNGIDTDRFHPVGTDQQTQLRDSATVRIGSCGRLDRVKDFATLIDAFSIARDVDAERELELVIVGDGPERDALAERLHLLGLDADAVLLGTRDDVDTILRTLDVYVCSSIAEGLPLTVLEAMASGLAVIATAVGGNPEAVDAPRTGLLVPADDAQALADALRQLCDAPDTARAMGAAGRERALAQFSLDGMADSYCALYDQCLAGVPRLGTSEPR